MISYTIVGETLVTPAEIIEGWPKVANRYRTDDVIGVVCETWGIDRKALKSRRRSRRVAWPRMAAYHLLRYYTGRSYPEIGRALGDKDHTTVMYGLKRVQEIAQEHENFRLKLEECVTRLNKMFPEC